MEEKLYVSLLKKLYYIDDLSSIRYAYKIAHSLHKGQFRDSGEAYIVHPLSVALILANLHADKQTICAALLHDTLEDTFYTLENLENDFGTEIANLVNGLTNLPKSCFDNKEEQRLYNSNKFIEKSLVDFRIIIIKLADRLHNMSTIEVKSESSKIDNSCETLYFYVPLARNLQINYLKNRLEDLSFKYLYSDIYKKLLNKRKRILSSSNFNNQINLIKELLIDEKIQASINVKIENIYGMYQDIINDKDLDIVNIYTVVQDEYINHIDSDIKKDMKILSYSDFLKNEYGICAHWFSDDLMQSEFENNILYEKLSKINNSYNENFNIVPKKVKVLK